MSWSNALRKRYTCVTKRFGCPPLPTRQNISVLLSDGLDGWLWQPLFYCNLNYAHPILKRLNHLRVFSWLPANKWIGMRFLYFCIHAEMISLIKDTLNERTYLMNFSDSNWAILSLIFRSPVSSQKQMPYKRLMIIIGIILMLLAMILRQHNRKPVRGHFWGIWGHFKRSRKGPAKRGKDSYSLIDESHI